MAATEGYRYSPYTSFSVVVEDVASDVSLIPHFYVTFIYCWICFLNMHEIKMWISNLVRTSSSRRFAQGEKIGKSNNELFATGLQALC